MVKAGNPPPEVHFRSARNKSFFWEGRPFEYSLDVSDAEDERIDPARARVLFGYDPSPSTLRQDPQEYGNVPKAVPLGYSLIERSDCKACHVIQGKSVGPSYTEVSRRYKGQPAALPALVRKVISGGAGNWGENLMSAHPQLAPQDVEEMVKYMLSLTEEQREMETLAPEGSVAFTRHKADEPRGVYTLSGSYTDTGANGIQPIKSSEVLKFRKARVPTVYMDRYAHFERFGNSLTNADHKAFYMLENVDLTGIRGFLFEYASEKLAGHIEVRLDSQAGPVILKTSYSPNRRLGPGRSAGGPAGKSAARQARHLFHYGEARCAQ